VQDQIESGSFSGTGSIDAKDPATGAMYHRDIKWPRNTDHNDVTIMIYPYKD
jgi:hypothetical protein